MLIKMVTISISKIVFVSACLVCVLSSSVLSDDGNSLRFQTYIVRMDKSLMPSVFATSSHWYVSTLASTLNAADTNTDDIRASILHVYDAAFEGFAAKMTAHQAKSLENMPGFIGLLPDTKRQLHTTHSPEFLNLNSSIGIWPQSSYGADTIIGVFDTGVWPEAPSFSDDGMAAVPSRWKGQCVSGRGFNASMCNKKLIGARIFYQGYEAIAGPINETAEYKSPRDTDGHGTHTASTAAGNFVYNASLFGYGKGTAQGMAPKARIAVYKVCWESGCFDSDILAAFDQAVQDGVDVISLSVGGGVMPYSLDSIAIGAFGAMAKGVFVSCSAGNNGPSLTSVTNIAPWIATIGASTMDRNFPANVLLGDGSLHAGESLYSGNPLPAKQTQLIYAGDATVNGSVAASASLCISVSLDPNLVQGKIVLCDRGNNARVEKGSVVLAAGGVGMILANAEADGEGLIADCHLLPATAVGYEAGNAIRNFIRSASAKQPSQAVGTIQFDGTKLGVTPAPVVASFSSRGPNSETPEILKPDLIAPGVNILAAWSGALGPTGLAKDQRRVEFNIISGTSMACPHVSGLAALLKAAHPQWSPAAIKSALMTSAYLADNTDHVLSDESTGNLSTPFDFGAGHVNPEGALDPGLIYDLASDDYIAFLCGLNYTTKTIKLIARKSVSCTGKAILPGNLNYPSFSAVFDQSSSSVLSVTLSRTATNVGNPSSVYTSQIIAPAGVKISVMPEKLDFTNINQKLSYSITIVAEKLKDLIPGESETVFGSLTWLDGSKHRVHSPIAITRQ